jgi:hypothetical protein
MGDVVKQAGDFFNRLGQYAKDPSLAGSDFGKTLDRLQGKPEAKKVGIYFENKQSQSLSLEMYVPNPNAIYLITALPKFDVGVKSKKNVSLSLIRHNIISGSYPLLTTEQKKFLTPTFVKFYNAERNKQTGR